MNYKTKHQVKRPLVIWDTPAGFKLEIKQNKYIRISLETFKHLTQ